MNATSPIAVGVAGWSYPDWNGFVYPPGLKDPLRFVAAYVDMVEVNSSFYRPPAASSVASWVARTDDIPGFFFSAKISREVTHEGAMPRDLILAFRKGFEPMVASAKLRHLLAQFRWDFADGPDARGHLREISEAFGDMASLTLELRHRSWEAADAMAFLGELGVTVANLDYPVGRDSFRHPLCTVGTRAYLRLHGRNAKAWFSKGAGRDETYNYLYNRGELDGIRSRAMELARMSTSLTIVANNHYQGKELVNAIQLRSLLRGHKVPAPPLLMARYDGLSAYAESGPPAAGTADLLVT